MEWGFAKLAIVRGRVVVGMSWNRYATDRTSSKWTREWVKTFVTTTGAKCHVSYAAHTLSVKCLEELQDPHSTFSSIKLHYIELHVIILSHIKKYFVKINLVQWKGFYKSAHAAHFLIINCNCSYIHNNKHFWLNASITAFRNHYNWLIFPVTSYQCKTDIIKQGYVTKLTVSEIYVCTLYMYSIIRSCSWDVQHPKWCITLLCVLCFNKSGSI